MMGVTAINSNGGGAIIAITTIYIVDKEQKYFKSKNK